MYFSIVCIYFFIYFSSYYIASPIQSSIALITLSLEEISDQEEEDTTGPLNSRVLDRREETREKKKGKGREVRNQRRGTRQDGKLYLFS